MRVRTGDLQRMDWTPPETRLISDWGGCSTEYIPVLAGDGWWYMVPIWDPERTPTTLRRWAACRAVLCDGYVIPLARGPRQLPGTF